MDRVPFAPGIWQLHQRLRDLTIYHAPVSIHVVLVHPEIHWNTGNAGRSCLAAGATLHLIEPLGFSLDERQVRRAGLDYWEHVDLRVWPDWATFETELPRLGDTYFFSTKAPRLRSICASPSSASRISAWRTTMRLTSKISESSRSPSLQPGTSRWSMIARVRTSAIVWERLLKARFSAISRT